MSLQVNQLIGFGAGRITQSFTFVGSCTSTSNTLNFGSLSAGAVAAGDILIYADYAEGALGGPSAVTPSGFTNHYSTQADLAAGHRGMLSWKKATGSEGSITGMNGGTADNKVGLVFRPVDVSYSSLSFETTAPQITAGNPSSQAPGISGRDPVIIIGVVGANGGTAAFSTASPAFDAEVANSDGDLRVGYKIYNGPGSTHTVDANDLGSNTWLAATNFTTT